MLIYVTRKTYIPFGTYLNKPVATCLVVRYICKITITTTGECMALWGKPVKTVASARPGSNSCLSIRISILYNISI